MIRATSANLVRFKTLKHAVNAESFLPNKPREVSIEDNRLVELHAKFTNAHEKHKIDKETALQKGTKNHNMAQFFDDEHIDFFWNIFEARTGKVIHGEAWKLPLLQFVEQKTKLKSICFI